MIVTLQNVNVDGQGPEERKAAHNAAVGGHKISVPKAPRRCSRPTPPQERSYDSCFHGRGGEAGCSDELDGTMIPKYGIAPVVPGTVYL